VLQQRQVCRTRRAGRHGEVDLGRGEGNGGCGTVGSEPQYRELERLLIPREAQRGQSASCRLRIGFAIQTQQRVLAEQSGQVAPAALITEVIGRQRRCEQLIVGHVAPTHRYRPVSSPGFEGAFGQSP